MLTRYEELCDRETCPQHNDVIAFDETRPELRLYDQTIKGRNSAGPMRVSSPSLTPIERGARISLDTNLL
jgi:hypothetical protein